MKSYLRSALSMALAASSLFVAPGSLESRTRPQQEIARYDKWNSSPESDSIRRLKDPQYIEAAFQASADPGFKRVPLDSWLSARKDAILILPVVGMSPSHDSPPVYADWTGLLRAASGSRKVVVIDQYVSQAEADRINKYLHAPSQDGLNGVRAAFKSSVERTPGSFPSSDQVIDSLVACAQVLKGTSAVFCGRETPSSKDMAPYARDQGDGAWMLECKRRFPEGLVLLVGEDLDYLLPRTESFKGQVESGPLTAFDDGLDGSGVKTEVLIPVMRYLGQALREASGSGRGPSSSEIKDDLKDVSVVDVENHSMILP